MNKLRVFSAVMLVLLLGAVSVPRAQAAPPEIVDVPFEYTGIPAPGLANFCGYQGATRDFALSQRIITYYDNNGNPTRELNLASGSITFHANGKSVTGRITGFDRYTFHQDGSITWLGVGPAYMVVLPGVGPVWGSAGHYVFELDADWNILSYTASGPDFADPAMCEALAP